MGALESALYRPQTGYYKDLTQEAAALFESLVINHPFVDENERVGLAIVDTFLLINGHKITVEPEKLQDCILDGLEQQAFQYEAIEEFLRKHTMKVDQRRN